MILINRDTKLYGSLSEKAGSMGCKFFNTAFEKHGINSVYKSFSVDNISKALISAQYLGFAGCAISMPFKVTAFSLMDEVDDAAKKVGNINTVLMSSDKMVGYNTDYYAAIKLINDYNKGFDTLYILGNGGLASSVKVAATELGLNVENIVRGNWDILYTLKNKFIFNCTPLTITPDSSNTYIDCLVTTESGSMFHAIQAKHQFKLYTGIDYENS
jgi:shikimate dehydrogenase